MDYLVTADFGTSGAKFAVFERSLRLIHQAYRGYPTNHPAPWAAEQDPTTWWDALLSGVAELLAHVPAARVRGIGLSSHYPSMLLVDGALRPLAPAWIWTDERGRSACAEVASALEEAPACRNGNRVQGFHPVAKLVRIARDFPELLRSDTRVLQASGYLVARLTGGSITIDPSAASWFHTFDLEATTWCSDVARALKLDPALFPSVQPASAVAGVVSLVTSAETGLPAGVPVIVGTGDAMAAALGAGTLEVGQGFITLGTGGCACVLAARPVYDPNLNTECYLRPGIWVTEGNIKNIGSLLRWFDEELGHTEREVAARTGTSVYAVMDAEAASVPPGAGGLLCLPYFSGEQSPINDPDARGVLVGLSSETRRPQIVRALMEGAALALQHNLRTIASLGVPAHQLRVVGGPAKSSTWCQIIADVTGLEVVRPAIEESAPLGLGILIRRALDADEDDLPAAATQHVVFEPRAEEIERYAMLSEAYQALYPAVRPIVHRLRRIRDGGPGC